MTKEELEKQIRAIIFDDEFEILGKVKFKNDEAVGPQIERFKIDALMVLIKEQKEITVREIFRNLGNVLHQAGGSGVCKIRSDVFESIKRKYLSV